MPVKKTLDLDQLAVDSFDTTSASAGARGTVHAHQTGDAPTPTPTEYACTCAATCLCKTNYYYCGTGQHSIYSCDFTVNASCLTPA